MKPSHLFKRGLLVLKQLAVVVFGNSVLDFCHLHLVCCQLILCFSLACQTFGFFHLSLFKAIRGFLFSGGAKICDDLIFFEFFLYMLQKTLISVCILFQQHIGVISLFFSVVHKLRFTFHERILLP